MNSITKVIPIIALGLIASGYATTSLSQNITQPQNATSYENATSIAQAPTQQTKPIVQVPQPPAPAITIDSLLAQTLESTQETLEKFDEQQSNEPSSNIAFPPAIDVSYAQVVSNISQNIGTDVRWGGQVIESVQINESTVRLTVFAYPLSDEGRPLQTNQTGIQGGRFVVDLTNGFAQGVDFNDHFLTFYGGVASRLVVTNGNRQKEIPIINAQEFVDWNTVDQNLSFASDRLSNSYYSLGSQNGRFGYRSHFYSPYYYGRSRLGFSSRHRSFSNRGLSRRGFSNRRFSSNRSFSNRGFRSRGFSSKGFSSKGFSNRSFRHKGFSKRGFSRRGFRRH